MTAAIDLQLSDLLSRQGDLYRFFETWADQQIAQITGSIDDPDSFDADGLKVGPLGYYPVVDVSGNVIYLPCQERRNLLLISAVTEGAPEAVADTIAATAFATAQGNYAQAQGAAIGDISAAVAQAQTYRNETQTAAATLPNVVKFVQNSDGTSALTDGEDFPFIEFLEGGEIGGRTIARILASLASMGLILSGFGTIDVPKFVIADLDGFPRVTLPDDLENIGGGPGSAVESWLSQGRLAELRLAISDGQSVSRANTAGDVVTVADYPGALTFVGSVRPDDSGYDAALVVPNGASPSLAYGSLVPYHEIAGSIGESTLGGATRTTPIAAGQMLINVAPGMSGATAAELSPGVITIPQNGLQYRYFDRLTAAIDAGAVLAAAANKTYSVDPIIWTHGHADLSGGTSALAYKNTVRTIRLAAEAKMRTATNDPTAILPMIVNVMGGHNFTPQGDAGPRIALAQIELGLEPYFLLGSPDYHVPHQLQPNVHPAELGPIWLGGYAGIIKKYYFRGERLKFPRCIGQRRQGNLVILTFDTEYPLELDDLTVVNPGAYGFTVVDTGGVDVPIAAAAGSVRVVAEHQIAITPAVPLPIGGVRARYAWKGTGINAGPAQGARGCLRDSAPETISDRVGSTEIQDAVAKHNANPNGQPQVVYPIQLHRWGHYFQTEIF